MPQFQRLLPTLPAVQIGLAILLTVLTLLPVAISPARADSNEASVRKKQDNATQATHQMNQITVTATKRETSLQDVPAGISVLSSSTLEESGVRDLQEATRLVPNVYMKKTGSGDSPIIRGISAFDTSMTGPAGLYIDDMAYSLNYMQNQMLFDVERIEFLRGPQGTLYGRNSESGVINVVFKKPDNDFRAKLLAEGGTYNTYRLGASLSGPIAEDRLYFGLSGLLFRTDGFMTNEMQDDKTSDHNDIDSWRSILRWTPDLDWDINLTLDGSERNLGMDRMRTSATGPFEVSTDYKDSSTESEYGQGLKVEYDHAGTKLTSISGHRSFNKKFHFDMDRTPVPTGHTYLDMDQDTYSQEFRLASSLGERFDWLMGAYGYAEDMDVEFDRNLRMAAKAAKRRTKIDGQEYALFGQGTYNILPDLHLTAGLRWDNTYSKGTQTLQTSRTTNEYDATLDDSQVLPKFSLAYDFTTNVTAYATWSQGYLAGGYNYNMATNSDNLAYDPEHSTNYETGLKSSWFDNRLTANLALFYIQIDDKQVMEGYGMSEWRIRNAAKAHSTGGELELVLLPCEGLQIDAGLGYAASEIDDWDALENGREVDYSGKKMPWAPETTYNVGATYTHSSGMYVRADMAGFGKQYFDASNTLSQGEYQLYNLRVGYVEDTFDVAVWCRNLFDTRYYNKMSRSMAGATLLEDGDPLTAGVTVTWRF
ncbi:MAG: TonB-dependent receptor [Desulfovibrio sp.]|uniref:TonB-dependent receptor n=1 Tax=Desulfovibrio sp. 7SRBS1 TaxID=3378064 RepID=UPI003B400D5A